MLQAFRLLINSFIGKVLFSILLLTFALLGVGYGFRDLLLGATSNNDAAKVGGQTITLNDLDRQYRRQLGNYQRQLGATFNPSTQQKQEVARVTLDQEVNDVLFQEQAKRDGFRVGDVLVRQVIQSEPSFAGEDKQFDAGRFHMLLENQGLTESSFVPLIRSSLARQLVVNPIAESAVAPRALVEDMYRYRNEQRVAETVTIPNSAATGIPAPTDAQIDTYYKAHATEFTAPEYRSFTVLSLTPDLYAPEIKPTDEELHSAYDQHKADYIAPEKRKITQVVLTDKATADAVVKAIQSGKTLADAAKTVTAGKIQPITIDFTAKDQYPDTLRDPVFAAAKNSIVGPVQSMLGWHVIHVDDVQAGHDVPFDQVKNILIDQVKHDGAVDKLSEQIDKLGDKLVGGTPMDSVASGVGATPVKVAAVDAKGQPATPEAKPDPTKPAPAKPNAAWIEQAFQLHDGETGSFTDDKNGGYFAVKLDAITPPTLRPLADVKAQIVTEWTQEQQAAQIVKRAQDLATKARAGTPLSQIASEAGVTVATTAPMTRDATEADKGSAPALVTALFQLNKVGDVVSVDGDNAQVIARLKEIRPADPATAGTKLTPIEKELNQAMQADTLTEYRLGLRDSLGVKINPKAAETVAGQ